MSEFSSTNPSTDRAMGRALSALSFLHGAGEIDEKKYTTILHLLGRNEDFLPTKDDGTDMPSSSATGSPEHAIVPIKLVDDSVSRGILPKSRNGVQKGFSTAPVPQAGRAGLSRDDVFGVSVGASTGCSKNISWASFPLQTIVETPGSWSTKVRVNGSTVRPSKEIDYIEPLAASTPRIRTYARQPVQLPKYTFEGSISDTLGTLASSGAASSPPPIKVSSEAIVPIFAGEPVVREAYERPSSAPHQPATTKVLDIQPQPEAKRRTPIQSSHIGTWCSSLSGTNTATVNHKPRQSSGLRFSQNAADHRSPPRDRGSLEPSPTLLTKRTKKAKARKSDIPKLISISSDSSEGDDNDDNDGDDINDGAEHDSNLQNADGAGNEKNARGVDVENEMTWRNNADYDNTTPKALTSSNINITGTKLTSATTPFRHATPTTGTPYRSDNPSRSRGAVHAGVTPARRGTPFCHPRLPRPTRAETRIIVCPWWSTYGQCLQERCPFQHRNLEAGIYQRLICPFWLGLHPVIKKCKNDAETCKFAHIEAKHGQWANLPDKLKV